MVQILMIYMKKSFFAKLSVVVLICVAFVSCEFSSSSESSFSYEIQNDDEQEGYEITGDPNQLLDISNDLVDYLKSAHINDEDDAQEFEDTIEDVKQLLQAVSDSINARMETMTPKEKGALIDQVSTVNEQLEENNPEIDQEIVRLVKEAKKIGITLAVDL